MHIEFAVLWGRGWQGRSFECSVRNGILKGIELGFRSPGF